MLLAPSERMADGFRKQILALTASGKVVALHNGDGRLLWSLDFGPRAAPSKLALWRVPHDVQHDIEARGRLLLVAVGCQPAPVSAALLCLVQRTLPGLHLCS